MFVSPAVSDPDGVLRALTPLHQQRFNCVLRKTSDKNDDAAPRHNGRDDYEEWKRKHKIIAAKNATHEWRDFRLQSKFITINEYRRRICFPLFSTRLLSPARLQYREAYGVCDDDGTLSGLFLYFPVSPFTFDQNARAIFTSIYDLHTHQFLTWLLVRRTKRSQLEFFLIYSIV